MINLFFRERGSGHPILLLHGFPMHQQVWDSFAEKLSKKFKVFTVDLPGFGKSPSLESPFTLADVANQVLAWMQLQNMGQCTLVGHSLGGYVALAMVEKAQQSFDRLVLFHSTALSDTEEKKQSRNKVLEFIGNNGVVAFTSNFIAPLFADPEHPAIANVESVSIEASEEAVSGYTQAMRDRPDRTDVIKAFRKPILFLAGEKDGGIPVTSIHQQAALSLTSEVHILTDVAHMGMFENENSSLEIIYRFIEKNSVTK
jgi:pimeloyl-ACP methyl ester carboxylesterase